MFEKRQYNGFIISLKGDTYQLLIHTPGNFGQREFDAIQKLAAKKTTVIRSDQLNESLIQLRSSEKIPESIREKLTQAYFAPAGRFKSQ